MKKCGARLAYKAVMGLLIMFAWGMSICVMAATDEVSSKINIDPPDAELVLTFSRPPSYTIKQGSRGKVISFNQALNIPDIDRTRKKLSIWLDDLAASYDALLISLKANAELKVWVRGNHLYLNFSLIEADNYPDRNSQNRDDISLRRADALYLHASGQHKAARMRIKELMQSHPDEMQLIFDLANIEEDLGNWGEALNLYNHIESRWPQSLPASMAKTRLQHAHGNKLSAGVLYNKLGSTSRQTTSRLEGRKLLQNGKAWLLEYENRDADEDADVRRINGDLAPFSGRRQHLTASFAGFYHEAEHRLSLYVAEKNPGLGWGYQRVTDYGRVGVGVEWRSPWFETPEALAGYGYKESLSLTYNKTFARKYSFSSVLSINSYGLDGVKNAARSHRLQLATRYLKLPGKPDFSLGYSFDLEDISGQAKLKDTLGNDFIPLPLDSREQHVIDVGWNKNWGDTVRLQAHLGYEYDRRRDASAPFGRMQVNYRAERDLMLKLDIHSGLSSYRGGEDELHTVGLSLAWFY